MTEAWAYAGAALLAAATLPQAARLLRTRSAADFGWSFVLLNAAGLAFLAVRSAELGEVPFLLVNALAFAFWSLAATVKALEVRKVKRKVVADGA
ncbi:MAG TPA: hypothetical protein VNB23_08175 [Ramlibacter sp.]|nr:hypothetical protein [Ramlibacter sp.]